MTDPTPDFLKMPGHLVRRLNQIATAMFRDHMVAIGLDLTPVQFAVLDTLSETPDIDQATLATLVAYDKVTIGGVIDRLEAKTLVDRRPSPNDRRAKILKLTPAGAELIARVRPGVRALQDDILVGLTEAEAQTLVTLLQKTTVAHLR